VEGNSVFKSIKAKLFIFVFLLIIGTTFLLSLFITDLIEKYLQKEVLERTELLAKSISASASYNYISKDILGLDHTIFSFKEKHQDIESIAIIDRKGTIIAHTDLSLKGTHFPVPDIEDAEDTIVRKQKNGFEIITTLNFTNKKIGYLVLELNKSSIRMAQQKVKGYIAITLIIILVFAATGTLFLSTFITRPINELIRGIEDLKLNRKIKPIYVYSDDELGRLTEHFNEMVRTITFQQESLNSYSRELEESFISTVKVLAAAIDARDPFTMGHSARIAILSSKLGESIGLSRREVEDIEIACLFHDIGKLRIPDAILIKQGPLDTSEYREIMKHPEYGAEILRRAPSLHKYIPAVLHHHEWYNGKGYPYGLKGKEIPVAASIIAVADAFDAMTSSRPYRKGLSIKDAMEELKYWAGRQFEPEIVKILLGLLEKEGNRIYKFRQSKVIL